MSQTNLDLSDEEDRELVNLLKNNTDEVYSNTNKLIELACVDNRSVLSTHAGKESLIRYLLNDDDLSFDKFYFISFNIKKDRLLSNRGKSKSFFGSTQLQQYNYFKQILLNNDVPADVEFAYTFYEQTYEGKIHFHQLIYMDVPCIWDYKAYLSDIFNLTRNEISSRFIHADKLYGQANDTLEYMFSKKTKKYEEVNQTNFKPHIYVNNKLLKIMNLV